MVEIKFSKNELVVLIRCLGNVLYETATEDLRKGKHIDDDVRFVVLNRIKEKAHKALLERKNKNEN